MSEQHRRVPIGIVTSIAAILLAAGGSVAYFTWQRSSQTASTPQSSPSALPAAPAVKSPVAASPLPSPPPSAVPSPAEPSSTSAPAAQVYWLRERGPDVSLEAAPVPVKSSDKPEAAIATALTTLLTAPADKSATTIPPGTQLRGITVKPEGIYVNLSKEFTAGGGSLSMYGRVGQVLYTATSLDPKAPVFLQVEGKPLETLGGEGLIIDQPLTRSLFEQGSGQKGE